MTEDMLPASSNLVPGQRHRRISDSSAAFVGWSVVCRALMSAAVYRMAQGRSHRGCAVMQQGSVYC